MSELRQRGKEGGSKRANAASSPGTLLTEEEEEEEDAPLVAAAHSAFVDAIAASNGATSDTPAAPATETMSDNAPRHNGSKLNIPAPLRDMFEKRRAELLAKYPDLLTKDLDEGNVPYMSDGETISTACRFDLIVFGILFALLALFLYVEYDVNALQWIGDRITSALDPGPIQRYPSGYGQHATEEALRNVKQKMQQNL